MAFAQAAARRPIAGAVATLGVSDRVAFLRKTYGLLGVSLVAFAALSAGIMLYATRFSWAVSSWALGGGFVMLLIAVLLFTGGMFVAQRLAMSDTSRGVQYLGLGLGILVQSLLLQPLLWLLLFKFGDRAAMTMGYWTAGTMTAKAASVLMQSTVITLAIFFGLTASVFISKKDFSFLRSALSIGTFALLGIILASFIPGFSLGVTITCGLGIVLMAGYILYETSLVLTQFPPSRYVAAALMLFGTIATLFRFVLQLMIETNRR
jgi:FtsH-binding integral membrane protein